jgi:hypothetical protein
MNKWMFRVCKRQHVKDEQMNAYTAHSFVHPSHVVFYIHGTFICSSFTCCLLHTRHIHLFILHIEGWTNECAVYVKDNMCRMNKSMPRVCKRKHVKDEQMHGTFICSSYTCCLLHTRTFICSSFTCCLLHTRGIDLFILHMLSFTYTAHSFVTCM